MNGVAALETFKESIEVLDGERVDVELIRDVTGSKVRLELVDQGVDFLINIMVVLMVSEYVKGISSFDRQLTRAAFLAPFFPPFFLPLPFLAAPLVAPAPVAGAAAPVAGAAAAAAYVIDERGGHINMKRF